jgi:hypothetical protein
MSTPSSPDPVRATLIAILQQLNQVESTNEGKSAEQALELGELENRLHDFWAVSRGSVKISLALGLLVRNGMVGAQTSTSYSWQRQRGVAARYQITAEGKKFLVQTLEKSERIA